jgi:hypothetical protein
MLRHTVATLAYRAGKALRGAAPEFPNYRADASSRTPVEILAHMGDLFDWALTLANGQQKWNNATPLPWDQEVQRFFMTLQAFDDRLASPEPLVETPEKLFQGPIADALTHTGQIAMLRRMAGCKIPGENYHIAEVVEGRVGLAQAAPRVEF